MSTQVIGYSSNQTPPERLAQFFAGETLVEVEIVGVARPSDALLVRRRGNLIRLPGGVQQVPGDVAQAWERWLAEGEALEALMHARCADGH